MNERYNPNETISILVQAGETILSSVALDKMKNPKPATRQIASDAASAKIATWIVTQPTIGINDDILQVVSAAAIGLFVEEIITVIDVIGGVNYV
jgi:hypothetical protein